MTDPVPDLSVVPRPKVRRRLLGQMLLDRAIIDQAQLDETLLRQKTERGSRVGRLLVESGYVTETQICEVVADQLNIPVADLASVDVAREVLSRVPKDICRKYVCLPWFVEGPDLFLIMADPTNLAAVDAVALASGLKVKPVVAPESEVAAAVERLHSDEEHSLAPFENIEVDIAGQLALVNEAETAIGEDHGKGARANPLVKLVNAILTDAIRGGASEVQIEPQPKAVVLRYRVDGLLRQVMNMPLNVQPGVVSRIKAMWRMDASERRKPQDGRALARFDGRPFDIRASTLPTADGEKVVIRIHPQEPSRHTLEDLGLDVDLLAALKDTLRRRQGLILVAGPGGSGKTTTLYASLNQLRSETIRIVTVEDPVEYPLAGVSQVAVTERAGLTFAAGLRSALRQEPDVLMVGEIRDPETARIAFQASQAGRLVLSALHAQDASSALTRLVEMGIPAYEVASSVLAVVAQRLVRRLCECKTSNPDGTASPRGCEVCRFTGFKGRTGVHELMLLTPRVRSVFLARGSDNVVRRAAQAGGMRTMFTDGLRKCAQGVTVLDEVARVVPRDSPGEDVEQEALPKSLSALAFELRPSRILVVDDDANLREVIEETLAAEGYEVLSASNGQEALRRVHRERPDLVLTDLKMPVVDGLELLKRLRKDLSTCQIPVVFLTVLEGLDSEARALDLGADDYLAKPVPRGRLLSRVRRALYRGQLMKSGH